jgi:hypothetical protein
MDWSWIYATVSRNTGWTYRKVGKQPACDIFKLLEHLAEYPPSYLIDAAVHLKQPSKVPREEDRRTAREAMSSVMGGAGQLPDHFKNLMEWEAKQVVTN